jgi:hypothetical protein
LVSIPVVLRSASLILQSVTRPEWGGCPTGNKKREEEEDGGIDEGEEEGEESNEDDTEEEV